ncbi:hypothetical protein QBC34DRAFT_485788 [Podospora aff. communis PSN243]|uniref:Uncharacterized protein n=1 Tax=Podospora aff. communis PSN243 TaxID=3040156 RepID=A0AAV9GLZ5_9PEZI|nr:hypothetical protein QBC34DRAFT_485788 [Podospora aff. communis PSN243]
MTSRESLMRLREEGQLLFSFQRRIFHRGLEDATPSKTNKSGHLALDILNVRPETPASQAIRHQNGGLNTDVCQRERVTTQNLDEWLDKRCRDANSTFILGLAVMSTHFGHRFRDFRDKVTGFPLYVLPFPSTLYPKIEEHFALPFATPRLLISGQTHFQHYDSMGTSDVQKQRQGFTMCLSSRGIIDFHIFASISWHPGTGMVNALLQGCSSQQQADISAQLQEFAILAFHPLLLPTILVELKMDSLEKEEAAVWNLLVGVETLSKQTATPEVHHAHASGLESRLNATAAGEQEMLERTGGTSTYEESFDSDLDTSTINVLGVLQRTTYAESHAKSLLPLIDGIRKGAVALRGKASQGDQAEYIRVAGEMLCGKLDFVENRTRVIMDDILFVEKRAQAQQSAIYNHLAQREAKLQRQMAENSAGVALAAKRDSSSMKAIAVLTMVFLLELLWRHFSPCRSWSSTLNPDCRPQRVRSGSIGQSPFR